QRGCRVIRWVITAYFVSSGTVFIGRGWRSDRSLGGFTPWGTRQAVKVCRSRCEEARKIRGVWPMPTSIPPPHALQQRDGERSRHRGRRDELLGGVPGEEVTGRYQYRGSWRRWRS
ncbi:unnamed protein product, partial [Ascophyllum nodosum]